MARISLEQVCREYNYSAEEIIELCKRKLIPHTHFPAEHGRHESYEFTDWELKQALFPKAVQKVIQPSVPKEEEASFPALDVPIEAKPIPKFTPPPIETIKTKKVIRKKSK